MNWDIHVNDEVDILRQTVKEFARKTISPIAQKIDQECLLAENFLMNQQFIKIRICRLGC